VTLPEGTHLQLRLHYHLTDGADARALCDTRVGEFDPGSANQEAALQFLPLFGLFRSSVLIFSTLALYQWSKAESGDGIGRIFVRKLNFGIFARTG
jgi:hypothetical protein